MLLYDDESRMKRAKDRAIYLNKLLDLGGKRVLEIGCGHGDLSYLLAEEYNCDVVGIDVSLYESWGKFSHRNLRFINHDIAEENSNSLFEADSFDRIISYCAWEHIRHPYAALTACQRILRRSGKKYLHAYLGGSAQLSHLYGVIKDPWIHLTKSVKELQTELGMESLPWYFWCNRLTHSQYLIYFRQLGFFITYEHVIDANFDQEFYEQNEKFLGLFPLYDLKSSALIVVLEFDDRCPKESIADPVYSKCKHKTRG